MKKIKKNLYLIIMKYKTFTHFMKKNIQYNNLTCHKNISFQKTDVFGKTRILYYKYGIYSPLFYEIHTTPLQTLQNKYNNIFNFLSTKQMFILKK